MSKPERRKRKIRKENEQCEWKWTEEERQNGDVVGVVNDDDSIDWSESENEKRWKRRRKKKKQRKRRTRRDGEELH
jgi:hypothetical protein